MQGGVENNLGEQGDSVDGPIECGCACRMSGDMAAAIRMAISDIMTKCSCSCDIKKKKCRTAVCLIGTLGDLDGILTEKYVQTTRNVLTQVH